MPRRVTHARAAALLDKQPDHCEEIGGLFPNNPSLHGEAKKDADRAYFNRMAELEYTRDEAEELLRYSRQ